MNLLLIDACPRTNSRSRRLGKAFVAEYMRLHDGVRLETLELSALGLQPLTGETEAARAALIAAGKLDDARFAPARAFAQADMIVICAPYWDFAFPACLKVLIEHVCVNTLTFTYESDGPVGLCRAENLVYLTSSGSPIGEFNFGGDYLRAITGGLLGVKRFHQISAEGLDIFGADAEGIVRAAEKQAQDLAAQL